MILYNNQEYRRAIIISDIHGCYKELLSLLEEIEPSGEDLLISVGDLLDRGPYGDLVVKYCRQVFNTVILGNHEERARRYRMHEERVKTIPGYINKMKHYTDSDLTAIKALSEPEVTWLNTLPTYIRFRVQDQDYLVVHGGFFPHYDIAKQDLKTVCRLRYIDKDTFAMKRFNGKYGETPENSVFWTQMWPGPERVIYGHEPRDEVKIDTGPTGTICYGIDTSCCFGRKLTGMIIDESNQISFKEVKAFETYSTR